MPGFGITGWINGNGVGDFVAEWTVVLPMTALFCLVIEFVRRLSVGADRRDRRSVWQRLAWRLCLIGLISVAALPALATLCKLLTPDPIPLAEEMPSPNGRDEFEAAWRMLGSNLLIESPHFDRDLATESQLVKAVSEVSDSLSRAEAGLQLPCMGKVDYSLGASIRLNDVQESRRLARAMDAAGRLAELQGDYDESFRWHLNNVRYGFALRRGGLIIDDLVGAACSNMGCRRLYEIRRRLTSLQCSMAINEINRLTASREPFSAVEYRDWVWTQRATGWMAHLGQWLEELTGATASYDMSRTMETVRLRLMTAELAIQKFRQSQGRLPASETEILCDELPELPIDPHSSAGDRLRYRRINKQEYLLYSVGPNGDDDHGAAPPQDEPSGWPQEGDCRLDVLYAP